MLQSWPKSLFGQGERAQLSATAAPPFLVNRRTPDGGAAHRSVSRPSQGAATVCSPGNCGRRVCSKSAATTQWEASVPASFCGAREASQPPYAQLLSRAARPLVPHQAQPARCLHQDPFMPERMHVLHARGGGLSLLEAWKMRSFVGTSAWLVFVKMAKLTGVLGRHFFWFF